MICNHQVLDIVTFQNTTLFPSILNIVSLYIQTICEPKTDKDDFYFISNGFKTIFDIQTRESETEAGNWRYLDSSDNAAEKSASAEQQWS